MAPKRTQARPQVPTDVYFKKTVSVKQSGHQLTLRVSQSLFSSFDVDVGTKFLLRTLAADNLSTVQRALDLGCGYGPLGLMLKRFAPQAEVHLVDRDALAVEYSRQNAVLNGIQDVAIYGSLGYGNVTARNFDLIVSNIPAKAGDAAIAAFLAEAAHYLAPDGTVAVVVVTPLEAMVERTLAALPHVEVRTHTSRPGHAVFVYRFLARPASNNHARPGSDDMYERTAVRLTVQSTTLTLHTAYGLPEFDTPAYDTDLILQGLQGIEPRPFRHAVVYNPRQGHTAVALHALLRPDAISLIDRDLLALTYTRDNLVRNGCEAATIAVRHGIGLAPQDGTKADIVVAMLRDDDGPEVIAWLVEQAVASVNADGILLIAGSSTAISRLVAHDSIRRRTKVEDRVRRMGYSMLTLRVLT